MTKVGLPLRRAITKCDEYPRYRLQKTDQFEVGEYAKLEHRAT